MGLTAPELTFFVQMVEFFTVFCAALFKQKSETNRNLKGAALMKRYEYVTVHIGKFCGAGSEEHRVIIDEYAAKGYRYVGYIPTNINDYGKIKDMDLVFETDC
ncbi:MAG: DUF4177 domain-containing protein [Clostridiales bacterium]|nr:DUF4177 domain-containing protein [Clostridiales bacterium]